MPFQFLSPEDILRNAAQNFIAPQLQIQGNVHSQTNLYINNTLQGNVLCNATVFVAADGHIQGQIQAENVVIWGQVSGDVVAQNIAAIGTSAQIGGQLSAAKFVLMPNPKLPTLQLL